LPLSAQLNDFGSFLLNLKLHRSIIMRSPGSRKA
jgi:hypothetical protein